MEEKKHIWFIFTHIKLPPKHELPTCSWFLTIQAHNESSPWHSDRTAQIFIYFSIQQISSEFLQYGRLGTEQGSSTERTEQTQCLDLGSLQFTR